MNKYKKGLITLIPLLVLFFILSCNLANTNRDNENDPKSSNYIADPRPVFKLRNNANYISKAGSFDLGDIMNSLSQEITFTIENGGEKDLVITPDGANVVVSGNDTASFTVTQQPDGVISPGTDTTFKITFTPTNATPNAIRLHSATITIITNDPDLGTFTFAVKGKNVVKFTPGSGVANDKFGSNVVMWGNFAVTSDEVDTVVIHAWNGNEWEIADTITNASIDFGASIDIYNDTLIVGAPGDDGASAGTGAAYVYKHNASTNQFDLVEKIFAPATYDLGSSDEFGSSVSISGDTILVGAPGAGLDFITPNGSIDDGDMCNNNNLSEHDAGVVYVFNWNGTNWIEQEQFTASSPQSYGYFGTRVSISGDHAIINNRRNEPCSGTFPTGRYVFMFHRNGAGNWVEQEALYETMYTGDGSLYLSVSLYGDYAITGNVKDGVDPDLPGSASIYHWDGADWTLQQKLTDSTGENGEEFGYDVDINGNYAVVGARKDDSEGSVLVYKRNGTSWSEVKKITAPEGAVDDDFGSSVSIAGDNLLVGAAGDDDIADSAGSIYMFSLGLHQKVEDDEVDTSDNFGDSVAMDGNYAVIGAHYVNNGEGAAFIYYWNGSGWIKQQKLIADDTTYNRWFGKAVSISGSNAIAGAYYDIEKGSQAGAAYIYRRIGSTWVQQQKLTANDGTISDHFGQSVGIYADYAVVGARKSSSSTVKTGAAYVYKWNGSSWVQMQKIIPDPGDEVDNDRFGYSIDIYEDKIIVGANEDNVNGSASGSAYIFKRTGEVWTQVQKLLAPDMGDNASDIYGWSVSIHGDYAAVGARSDDNGFLNNGSVYIYHWTGATWEDYQQLVPQDAGSQERFGFSVSLENELLVVGTDYDRSTYNEDIDIGGGYLYHLSGSTWVEFMKLTPFDGAHLDTYGCSVGISGDKVIVGSNADDVDSGVNAGSVHFYQF